MTNALIIYANDGITKIFELDVSSITVEDQKSVEPLEIPGQLWNTHFDSISVTARWIFEGTFQGSTKTWDDSTYTGTPIDFIMKLRARMKNVNDTGVYSNNSIYDSFKLSIAERSGTNGATNPTNISSYYSGAPVQFILQAMNFKKVGGEPNKVDYTLTFLEILDVTRLG